VELGDKQDASARAKPSGEADVRKTRRAYLSYGHGRKAIDALHARLGMG
jgi:hypothetical protein